MSGSDTRFRKGQSGNPKGRPKARRPNVSAFDIIFDKTLTVNQGGIERELTVDEALQLQTYQAALKGSRMAARTILKMIEKREGAMATFMPGATAAARFEIHHDSENANDAMLILGIAVQEDPPFGGGLDTRPLKIATWAAQAALSRPGRRRFDNKDIDDIKRQTIRAETLKWPRKSRS